MKIKIHRGQNIIGGTCIEVISNETRIIIDFGIPLTDEKGKEIDYKKLSNPTIENGLLPKVDDLYNNDNGSNDNSSIDAILISHSHLDHYGLLNFVENKNIPIYLSRDTETLIKTGNIFWKESMKQNNLFKQSKNFEYYKEFRIGNFKITPFLIDHSAIGSVSFLIEDEIEKDKLFYTGDLRAHGRKKYTYTKLLTDKRLRNQNIDYLITEGTTLGSKSHDVRYFKDEIAVENKMDELFAKQKDISFVISAGSNIDRLISIYKATKRSNKILVLDLYQFFLLEELKKNNPDKNKNLPPFDNDHIRIYFNKYHEKKLKRAIGDEKFKMYKCREINIDTIKTLRKRIVLRLSLNEMDKINFSLSSDIKNSLFIYSMWSGYLKKDSSFNNFIFKHNLNLKKVHTSGHIYEKDLFRLIDTMKPKSIIPVHTLDSIVLRDRYKNIVL